MNANAIIRRLEWFGGALPVVVGGLTIEEARYRPASGAWSVLEIVNHLCDEEVEDFGARLRFVLESRKGTWGAIDPEGWARERRYNDRNLLESVERFVASRRASVAWLRGIAASADWRCACEHPKLGAIRAGDLLAAWAAHDALHLRQIAKRVYELAGRDAPGFRTEYGGVWGT
jgi:hypothetical protein